MKTIPILFAAIFLTFYQAEAQFRFSLCSGSGKTLEVSNYIPGTTFSWYLDNVSLNSGTPKYIVAPVNTTSQISKQYSCILKLQGMPYDTVDFVVTVSPVTVVDISATELCEGKLAKLTFSNQSEIINQTWTIGNETFTGKNIDYLCGAASLIVKLQVENKYGCPSEVTKTLPVSLKPVVTISEKSLTQNSLNGIYCGNSLAEFEVKGLTGNVRVTTWKLLVNNTIKVSVTTTNTGKIIPSDKSLVDWVEITASGIRMKWVKTTASLNVRILTIVSNGTCEYSFETSSILINDTTPDLDSVYQEPYNSATLIYPSGQSKSDINYEWGYTTPAGINNSVNKSKVFYQEYDNLNPSNRYWVETWFTSNDACRIRNYVTRVVASAAKSALAFRFYPNPVVSEIVIQVDEPLPGKLEINDLIGAVSRSVVVTGESKVIRINLSGIKPGVYLLRYIGNSGEILATDSFIVK